MRAGLLTEIINILRPQKVISEYGEEKTEYIQHYTTRACIRVNKLDKDEENFEIVYTNVKQLTIRYYVPVEEYDIIEYSGKRYKILSIEPKREYNEKYLTIELFND